MQSNNISESNRKRSRPVTKKSIFERNKFLLPFLILVTIIIIVGVVFVFNPFKENDTNNSTTGNPVAIINTSLGTIKLELYKDKVPNTVNNFVNLSKIGFYNGLVFHRVIDGFMIQSGGFDSAGTPKESPYGSINLEVRSDLKHDDGAISMARQGSIMTDSNYFNTATSQFFICDGPQNSLDNYYAVFGKVTEGMNIVKMISSVDTTTKYGMSNWPVSNVIINSITIENN